MKVFLLRAFCLCLLFPLVACRVGTQDLVHGVAGGATDQTTTGRDHPTVTMVASVEPLAARVNGQPISEQEHERAVLRYEAALQSLGFDTAGNGDYREMVLAQVIDKRLIAQEAQARGLKIDSGELQNAVDESVQLRGGEAGLYEWLHANHYSEAEFRQELRLQLLANKVQAEVLTTVGTVAEQVRARHVLVTSREHAEALQVQLDAGADFATLAVAHSLDRSTSVNGGDLGWFPRGLLTTPELEAAVFELAPGAHARIVETSLGFHIVEVIERDLQRELSPQAALAVRKAAVDSWLAELRVGAEIERFVP